MSTRCLVGVEDPGDLTVRYIYVHFDGYLDGVGHELLDGYTDREAAERLVAQGNSSTLEEPYAARGEKRSTGFAKDRAAFKTAVSGYTYGYLYGADNTWLYIIGRTDWTPLTTAKFRSRA